MPVVRLIHWKSEECPARAALLEPLGHTVDASPFTRNSLTLLRQNPPAAILIDLSRLPAHGLELAVALRRSKATRLVPLIFLEGAPAKLPAIQSTLPDARYTTYANLGPVLDDVLASPPREAVVPAASYRRDSPTPLAKKLGCKPGQAISLVNSPAGFASLLPGVPIAPDAPLTLHFVTSEKELLHALRHAPAAGLWLAWPRTTRHTKPSINAYSIRALALAFGLVDFKICSLDETWSAMRFARKRP